MDENETNKKNNKQDKTITLIFYTNNEIMIFLHFNIVLDFLSFIILNNTKNVARHIHLVYFSAILLFLVCIELFLKIKYSSVCVY